MDESKGRLKMSEESRSGRGVIDAERWLKQRAVASIRRRDFDEAIGYLRRLIDGGADDPAECRYATHLGYLYLIAGDLDEADRWLLRALGYVPHNPHLKYARGHVAAGRGRHATAALRFVEAFVEAKSRHDEAEFLRSGALAVYSARGCATSATAMLLGALDRDLGNPWILDALARVYEADEQWMETLDALSKLAEVVSRPETPVVRREPVARHLLRNQLVGRPARPEELESRVRAVNEAVRRQFQVVLDDEGARGSTQLAPLRFPPALNRLVRNLEWHRRGGELVETAQHLWARARGARFDEMLGRTRLAAAIQLLVERLHWRVPTPLSELARLHGASETAVPAAARVVAGRLGLEPFGEAGLKTALDFPQQKRFEDVARALLVGEGLKQVRSEIRLGV